MLPVVLVTAKNYQRRAVPFRQVENIFLIFKNSLAACSALKHLEGKKRQTHCPRFNVVPFLS
jgi:hypothetical protein